MMCLVSNSGLLVSSWLLGLWAWWHTEKCAFEAIETVVLVANSGWLWPIPKDPLVPGLRSQLLDCWGFLLDILAAPFSLFALV